MFRILGFALAIATLGLSACKSEGVTGHGPDFEPSPLVMADSSLPVEMSASRYVLANGLNGWQGELDFTFRNDTDRLISLLNCNGTFALRLEKWENGTWVPAWSPILPECLSLPIEVPPGENYQHQLHVFSRRPGSNTHPQFYVDPIDGTYRLVILAAFWDYHDYDSTWGEEPPLEYRVSAPFEISTAG
ncbi:MAG: hypothetical protein GEU90_09310 [Gemmatimonas sp.]|nr:hypothetical protein [Gemmatimonas sp.]